jgi:uncharacterized membrane protein (UPF0127 family)
VLSQRAAVNAQVGAAERRETMMARTALRRRSAALTFTAALLASLLVAFGLLAPGNAIAGEMHPLEIVTKSGVQVFTVEEAKTEEERERGLMFRTALPEGQGMIFDFSPEQNVSMWMKNTLIPLDMIFIRADGRILRIAENTRIKSEDIIPSGGPVRAVVEVIAGTAKKFGIAAGDKVSYASLFKR